MNGQFINIERYIKKDREGIETFINTVVQNEYEIKNTNLLERILKKLDKMEEKTADSITLEPILFDTKQEIKMQEEKTKKDSWEETIVDYNANMIFVNDLLQTVVSEMNTSAIQVSRLIENSSNSKTDIERRLQLNTIKNNLESDIKTIVSKAQKEIPEFGRALENQERQMYAQIEGILQEYKELNKDKNSKEEFRNRLKQDVNIDEKLALENVEKKKNDNIMELPGNIIE